LPKRKSAVSDDGNDSCGALIILAFIT
jgi:hypothetical protein